MADGISLAFQNSGTSAIGAGGGDLGYTGLNGVGSIIQTWGNNTVGLNTNGNAYSTKATPLHLGDAKLVTGNETVNYNAATHLLSMTGSLNVAGTSYAVSDTATVNLSEKFGATMYAGFTGATGGSYADQRITSFNVISAVPEPQSYALMLAGLGLMATIAHRRKKTQP
jgi:hypothetical protein